MRAATRSISQALQNAQHFRTSLVITIHALVALVFPAIIEAQERVPVRTRDLELRGVIRQDSLRATAELQAYVATPFGRIPVTGHARLAYTCAGVFYGSIDYHPLIRLLARLKEIDLVTRMEGRLSHAVRPACTKGPDLIVVGRAVTDSLELTGWARVASDSFSFRGITWYDGADHHGIAASVDKANRIEIRYTLIAHQARRKRLSPVLTGDATRSGGTRDPQ